MASETIVGDPTRSIVAAVFPSPAQARNAYNWLRSRGYPGPEITLIMSEHTRNTGFNDASEPQPHIHVEPEGAHDVATGAGIGTVAGLAAGTAVGAVAALATVSLPGMGLLVAGPMLGGLTGALTGGLIGGMTGLMETDEKSHTYEDVLRHGGVLVAVAVHPGDEDAVGEKLRDLGGEAIHITGREAHASKG
jgi:hypothetical protein